MHKNNAMAAQYFTDKDFYRMVQQAVCQGIYCGSLQKDRIADSMTDAP